MVKLDELADQKSLVTILIATGTTSLLFLIFPIGLVFMADFHTAIGFFIGYLYFIKSYHEDRVNNHLTVDFLKSSLIVILLSGIAIGGTIALFIYFLITAAGYTTNFLESLTAFIQISIAITFLMAIVELIGYYIHLRYFSAKPNSKLSIQS